MKDLDKKLQEVIRLIELSGGSASIPIDADDSVKQQFIDMIARCPDCQAAIRKYQSGGAS